MNYFVLSISALYLLGSIKEYVSGNPYIAGTFVCYAIANMLLLSIK